VVNEAPFYTQAFPGVYLTGSKKQKIFPFLFKNDETVERYKNRELIFSLDIWKVAAVSSKLHTTEWNMEFSELNGLSSNSKKFGTSEFSKVQELKNKVRIVGTNTVSITNDVGDCGCEKNILAVTDENQAVKTNTDEEENLKYLKTLKKFTYISEGIGQKSYCGTDEYGTVSIINFDSLVVSVFAVLDSHDTEGKLTVENIANTGPLPTNVRYDFRNYEIIFPNNLKLFFFSLCPSATYNHFRFFNKDS
jgi:hypothetical protein